MLGAALKSMDPPFVIELTIEELKYSPVVRANAETLRSRNAPTRFDGVDFQAFPEPVQGDRPLGVGGSGVAFDEVQERSRGQSVKGLMGSFLNHLTL